MKLFVSYARVDKPYCIQIVDMLDIHEIWYDQRLYAGQHWWQEILRRLDWCEGFVYLLSPESVQSEYCRREFELAQTLARPVFPVRIHPDTVIPDILKDVQYADLSKGLTPEAVKVLLNAIHLAENERFKKNYNDTDFSISGDVFRAPTVDSGAVISAAAAAMENGQFDHAVYLLKQAKERGIPSRFIDIDALLAEAEAALERQAYLREAERDYKQIVALLRHKRTFKIGCEAFKAFRQEFKDYDPENLVALCEGEGSIISDSATPDTKIGDLLPGFEWCPIPDGNVRFRYVDEQNQRHETSSSINAFYIGKYPITNAQYQVFLDDPQGYANKEWWRFSKAAYQWRGKHLFPKDSAFKGNERPREMVNWYDAVAFCNWLSDKMGAKITLPTVFEWQRAFQGNDYRAFPWGNKFDKSRCNTQESQLKMTTLVNRYDKGVSPFGVFDMAGNVWEWCLNLDSEQKFEADMTAPGKRVIRGGSFMSPGLRSIVSFVFYLKPESHYSSIGFRVVWKID